MARAASKSVSTRSTGTNIALIDQELANDVANLKNQISQPSGNKIKVDPTGKFLLPDGLDLGNEIQVAIVDFTNRNFFYSAPYTPNQVVPPDCYAMGKEISGMTPEKDSPAIQSDACSTCELNRFGSGNNGKGKACQNRKYVAVLLVDPDNPDAHNDPSAPIYLLDLSPSNLRSFDAVIRHTTSLMGHWCKAIYTVTAENAGTYAAVSWTSPVPNPDYAAHFARRAEVQDQLLRRPDFSAASTAKPASRQPARRTAGARR